MKKLRILLMMVLVAGFVACEDKETEKPIIEIGDGTYVGKLSVDQNDDTIYEQENVEINIEISDDNTMKIVMLQVKFAEAMPMKLNMTIEGIETAETDNGLSLSGDNIIPIAAGGQFPLYTITEMEGEVTSQNIEFSMMCGEYPLTFSGVVKSE